MLISKPVGHKIRTKELLIKAEDLRERLIADTRFEDSMILRDLMILVRGKNKRKS